VSPSFSKLLKAEGKDGRNGRRKLEPHHSLVIVRSWRRNQQQELFSSSIKSIINVEKKTSGKKAG
jgi:hypothetical protein